MTGDDVRPAAAGSQSLQETRAAYDAAAATYARLFRDSLRDSPLDLGVLRAFAGFVTGAGAGGTGASGASAVPVGSAEAQGGGPVADLGCGPGHVTAHLAELGLSAFGVDASPAMVALAREAYPGLHFEVGAMDALRVSDGALAGILARWSVIHTPPAELPHVLREFHRVLVPGGHLLLGLWAADDPADPVRVFDHAVAPAYAWHPGHLSGLLRTAGLSEVARATREPQPTDRRQFRELHLLVRKDADAGDQATSERGRNVVPGLTTPSAEYDRGDRRGV